jgi:hypothetical protein
MNEVFTAAKAKGTKFVNDNITLLKQEFTSDVAKERTEDVDSLSDAERDEIAEWGKLRSEVEGYITNLEAEWNSVPDWVRPW